MDDQKVKRATSGLILTQPFFASLLCSKLSIREDLSGITRGTAATDGRLLWLNPDFVDSLSLEHLKALLAHEVLHCAYGHVWRLGNRDEELWNVAADYVVNAILAEAGFSLPDGALIDPAFYGMSVEVVYDLLIQRSDSKTQLAQSGQAMWGQIIPAGKKGDEELQVKWEVAVLQAAQVAKMMGKLPSSLERLVSDIQNPSIDWKSALKRFVQETAKNDYSWQTPNKRYLASGFYLPALRSEQMGQIVWGFDTSGSVNDAQLMSASAEAQSVMDECQPESMLAIYCDAKVQGTDTFYPGDEVLFKLKGGGGTDFRPIFQYVEDEQVIPACMIIATDLEGCFPDDPPDYPVLWLNTGERDSKAPFGETIYFAE